MIRVQTFNDHPGRRVRHEETRNTAAAVVRTEGRRQAEIRLIFTTDARMRTLNARWLGHRSTTDVLSFPFGEGGTDVLEGEVYVNLDQARRQAVRERVSDRNEISRLVIHGVLHLLGYDDRTPAMKKIMSGKEDEYLRSLALQ
jgi:probable rRNA maturation factor